MSAREVGTGDATAKVELRVAASEEDRQAVYRFRYAVYVEQMQRRQTYADHAKKIIREPLDENGCIVAAFKGDEVVATLRANFMNDPAAEYYRKLYRVDLFEGVPLERMTMTTKLMVLPAYQRSALPLKTIGFVARANHYKHGVLFDLIDCNKPLIRFFEKFGYHSYLGWAFHKEFGTVRPMFLTMSDLAHLESCGSPFLKVANMYNYPQCEHSRGLRLKLAQPYP